MPAICARQATSTLKFCYRKFVCDICLSFSFLLQQPSVVILIIVDLGTYAIYATFSLSFVILNLSNPVSMHLDCHNYLLWRSQFEPLLLSHDLIGFVDGSNTCPEKYQRDRSKGDICGSHCLSRMESARPKFAKLNMCHPFRARTVSSSWPAHLLCCLECHWIVLHISFLCPHHWVKASITKSPKG